MTRALSWKTNLPIKSLHGSWDWPSLNWAACVCNAPERWRLSFVWVPHISCCKLASNSQWRSSFPEASVMAGWTSSMLKEAKSSVTSAAHWRWRLRKLCKVRLPASLLPASVLVILSMLKVAAFRSCTLGIFKCPESWHSSMGVENWLVVRAPSLNTKSPCTARDLRCCLLALKSKVSSPRGSYGFIFW